MGGDYAPKANVLGAIAAHPLLSPGEHIVLIGDTAQIKPLLVENGFNPDHFEYVHTEEVIGMGEHPTKAIVQKPNSSISVGYQLLKKVRSAHSQALEIQALCLLVLYSVLKLFQG